MNMIQYISLPFSIDLPKFYSPLWRDALSLFHAALKPLRKQPNVLIFFSLKKKKFLSPLLIFFLSSVYTELRIALISCWRRRCRCAHASVYTATRHCNYKARSFSSSWERKSEQRSGNVVHNTTHRLPPRWQPLAKRTRRARDRRRPAHYSSRPPVPFSSLLILNPE